MPTNTLMTPITRSQGCWNCIHYASPELVKPLWDTHKARLLRGRPERSKMSERLNKLDASVADGRLGVCLKGGVDSDFVEYNYLCPSGWTGRQGASTVRDAKLDPSIAELRDLLGLPSVS